jgi:hypothetical protein
LVTFGKEIQQKNVGLTEEMVDDLESKPETI